MGKKQGPIKGRREPKQESPGLGLTRVTPFHPPHRGEPVQVGPYKVLLGGTRDLRAEDLEKAEILIPLLQELPPLVFGRRYEILAAPLADFGGVPLEWGNFLRQQVIPLLAEGRNVLAFCMGSHGRTGTFLASLIALIEPETADPIAAARERHCLKSVESMTQAEAIFALRGEKLPERYSQEFAPRLSLAQDPWTRYGLGWNRPGSEGNSDPYKDRF